MARFNLAIDLGQAEDVNKADRYVLIDVSKLNPEIKKSGFANYDEAVKFTASYDNYTQLFMHALSAGLVSEEMVGNPFTYCYENNKKIWKHYGDNSFIANNKVLFKNDAHLMVKPSAEDLKNAYKKGNTNDIIFPITEVFLRYELNIPNYFDKENASTEEKEKVKFIEKLIKTLRSLVNQKKKAKVYKTNQKYTNYVDAMDGLIKDIATYLTLAVNDHTVNSYYFSSQLKKVINDLCLSKDDKNKTYTVVNSSLYELATFYKAFNESCSYYSTYEQELNVLEDSLVKMHNVTPFGELTSGTQIDLWGNPVSTPAKARKRK